MAKNPNFIPKSELRNQIHDQSRLIEEMSILICDIKKEPTKALELIDAFEKPKPMEIVRNSSGGINFLGTLGANIDIKFMSSYLRQDVQNFVQTIIKKFLFKDSIRARTVEELESCQ
jgi:hypothetical protein